MTDASAKHTTRPSARILCHSGRTRNEAPQFGHTNGFGSGSGAPQLVQRGGIARGSAIGGMGKKAKSATHSGGALRG